MPLKKIAMAIAVLISISLAIFAGPGKVSDRYSVSDYRNGFRLSTEKEDRSGILADTAFILEAGSSRALTAEFIAGSVFIKGEETPHVEKLQSGAFRIIPVKPLSENRVYIIGINETDGTQTTWAVQTASGLSVISVFPGNKSVNVPLDAKIVIELSRADYIGYGTLFSIYPEVKGKLEQQGNSLVFTPDFLLPDTVYTVTLMAGTTAAGAKLKITSDYAYSFATVSAANNRETNVSLVYFQENMSEFSTTENISLPLIFVSDESISAPFTSLSLNIYAFKSIEDLKEAYESVGIRPYWTQGYIKAQEYDTKVLSKVFENKYELENIHRTAELTFVDLGITLPEGCYIAEAESEGRVIQHFIQVTDTAAFIINTQNEYFIWIKNLETGENASDAFIETGEEILKADENGTITWKTRNGIRLAVIKAGSGELLVELSEYEQTIADNDAYRCLFLIDSLSYMPGDKIRFFANIENIYDDTSDIDKLDISISAAGGDKAQEVVFEAVSDSGFFSGEIQLPYLKDGSYSLQVSADGNKVAESYIRISRTSEPTYHVRLSKDLDAAIMGEPVIYEIQAFYKDNTPVPGLDLQITAGGSENYPEIEFSAKTDRSGKYIFEFIPQINADQTNEMTYCPVQIESSLAGNWGEKVYDNLLVYASDIVSEYKAEIVDGKALLSISLEYADTANFKDDQILTDPPAGIMITGIIYRNEYVSTVAGQYYDYLNKLNRDSISIEKTSLLIRRFELITDTEGKAAYEFKINEDENAAYYTADIYISDQKGRTVKKTLKFDETAEKQIQENLSNYTDSRLLLTTEPGLIPQNRIEVLFMGSAKESEKADFAYILLQNGIRSTFFSSQPQYTFEVTEDMMPGITVAAVCFNGRNFEFAEKRLRPDKELSNLSISALSDKETYLPGDTAVINIQAVSPDDLGNTAVSVSVVNEGINQGGEVFKEIIEKSISPSLAGIRYRYSTHRPEKPFYDLEFLKTRDQTAQIISTISGYNLLFRNIITDENGRASFSLRLPEKSAIWRVDLLAISENDKTGSDSLLLEVKAPLSVEYVLPETFLKGDRPFIGIYITGEEVLIAEEIKIQIESRNAMNEHPGVAHEWLWLPLQPVNEEGSHEIVVRAITASGVKKEINIRYDVRSSHRSQQIVKLLKAGRYLELPLAEEGLQKYIFRDTSIAFYADQLYSMAAIESSELGKKAVSYIADKYIKTYYDGNHTTHTPDFIEYQNADGGLAPYPYAPSEIYTTAMLLPFLKDLIDIKEAAEYLYSALEKNSSRKEQITALYGLSYIGEPVLLKLKEYEAYDDKDIFSKLLLALAYVNFGENAQASRIYNQYIAPNVVSTGINARLESGEGLDERLSNTALLLMLSSKLDLPLQEALFNYVSKAHLSGNQIIVEKISYIMDKLESVRYSDSEIRMISYEGIKIIKPGLFGESIPSMPDLEGYLTIDEIKGDVSVIALYEALPETSINNSLISINRTFLNVTSPDSPVAVGDMVRINIEVTIKKEAPVSVYELTDHLPSGLEAVDEYSPIVMAGKVLIYAEKKDQSMYYSINRETDAYTNFTLSYLARALVPGEFAAEGPDISSLADRLISFTGADQKLEILR